MKTPSPVRTRTRRGRVIVALAVVVVLLGFGAYAVQAGRSRVEVKGRTHYAAAEALPTGDGTLEHPISLAAALSADSPVLPGDTLILRGGTYRGPFVSELRGTETDPIVVRQMPGERATIDAGVASIVAPGLYVKGAWTTYRDFEVMSSDGARVIVEGGSQPTSLRRGMGVDVHAPHTRLVNLIVHDLADGIGLWSDAEDAEAYGNIVYHNGWSASDRSHGHGIYTQNQKGTRRVTDNIVFNQFSHGVHAYGSDAAWLDHIELIGNVVFNNGALDAKYYDRNILLGGQRVAADPVVVSNYTYYTPRVRHGGENNLGYAAGCTNLVAKDNYFAGQLQGGAPLVLSPRCAGTITGNVFYGPMDASIGQRYPENTYVSERPTGTKTFVRRHQYDGGRAHVIVYNWDRLPELTLDLSEAGLDPNERFELRDAENIFGSPVAAGVFGKGQIKVELRSLQVVPPIGDVATPVHTAPEFAVFVLVGSPKNPRGSWLAEMTAGAVRSARQWLP